MGILKNLQQITDEMHQINPQATLVVVSKKRSVESIRTLYDAGHRDFGENQVQELCQKKQKLPEDIRWHFIGHLQNNKVKKIVNFIHLIHSIDSLTLIENIDKRALLANRQISCLLQVHIAKESHKYGFHVDEIKTLGSLNRFKNIKFIGFMAMATLTDDTEMIKKEFLSLKKLSDQYKKIYGACLSIGMSQDYFYALQCGSNMLRIGSKIFQP